jgi:DNA-binding transcriptional ArsR family regulator
MVKQLSISSGLSATFAALTDPARRAILGRLASGKVTVSELAGPFAMNGPGISKHLKVLEQAGLISRGRQLNGGHAGSKRLLLKPPPIGSRNIVVSERTASTGSITVCRSFKRGSNEARE